MHGTIETEIKNPARLIREAYALGSVHQFQAEIRRVPRPDGKPGFDIGWHVVITIPGQEHIAAAHLIGRRFGIYCPEIEVLKKGVKTKKIMFSGYLFVFVWDIAFHWDRICKCPGIIGILAPIADEHLQQVQAIENEKQPIYELQLGKKKKRWRNRKITDEIIVRDEIVAVRPWSALRDGADSLDKEARNNLLRKVLGLA